MVPLNPAAPIGTPGDLQLRLNAPPASEPPFIIITPTAYGDDITASGGLG